MNWTPEEVVPVGVEALGEPEVWPVRNKEKLSSVGRVDGGQRWLNCNH